MTTLAVVLEEGFDDDAVVVRAGDDIVFRSASVTTRTQIGVAEQFTVDTPDESLVLSVEVPSRGLAADIPVAAGAGTHVGISIAGDQVVHRTADEPFRYA